MRKETFLHVAEIFDSWRVIPRLIMFLYLWFAGWVTTYLLVWYTHLPVAARTTLDTGVVGIIVTAVTGFFPSVLKVYQDGGRDWNAAQPAKTSTVVATTQEAK